MLLWLAEALSKDVRAFNVFGYLTLRAVLACMTALVISFVVGGTMLALLAAFSTYLRMAYYTCLYLWAVEVERAGQSAPAPLPLAIALGHRDRDRRAA